MSSKNAKLLRNFRSDLAKPRQCRGCGREIVLATGIDVHLNDERTVLVDPTPTDDGWIAVNQSGIWIDDTMTIEGLRYRRHLCQSRAA